jgi:predicted RNA-binding protein associated with RNAse of E/G family
MIHPPKVELFDVRAGTNTDPKGFTRPVEEYRVEPFGLYMARPVPAHPTLAYLESWLLPSLGLRVTDFWMHPGHERDQDFYIDIVDVTVDATDGSGEHAVWRTVDHYLDIVVRTGRGLDVLDIDELTDALLAGLLDGVTAQRALATVFRTVDALAGHGYDLTGWLSGLGMTLRWRRR